MQLSLVAVLCTFLFVAPILGQEPEFEYSLWIKSMLRADVTTKMENQVTPWEGDFEYQLDYNSVKDELFILQAPQDPTNPIYTTTRIKTTGAIIDTPDTFSIYPFAPTSVSFQSKLLYNPDQNLYQWIFRQLNAVNGSDLWVKTFDATGRPLDGTRLISSGFHFDYYLEDAVYDPRLQMYILLITGWDRPTSNAVKYSIATFSSINFQFRSWKEETFQSPLELFDYWSLIYHPSLNRYLFLAPIFENEQTKLFIGQFSNPDDPFSFNETILVDTCNSQCRYWVQPGNSNTIGFVRSTYVNSTTARVSMDIRTNDTLSVVPGTQFVQFLKNLVLDSVQLIFSESYFFLKYDDDARVVDAFLFANDTGNYVTHFNSFGFLSFAFQDPKGHPFVVWKTRQVAGPAENTGGPTPAVPGPGIFDYNYYPPRLAVVIVVVVVIVIGFIVALIVAVVVNRIRKYRKFTDETELRDGPSS